MPLLLPIANIRREAAGPVALARIYDAANAFALVRWLLFFIIAYIAFFSISSILFVMFHLVHSRAYSRRL